MNSAREPVTVAGQAREGDRTKRWLPWVVLAATALVYLPSLSGGWVWDDHFLLEKNPALHEPLRLLTSGVWSPLGSATTDLYRPLVMLTYFHGQQFLPGPTVERVLNLLLHLAAVVFVAQIAVTAGAAREAAWLGAAIFGMHTAGSEPVAWITGRHDLLPATLVLLGWWLLLLRRDLAAGLVLALAPFAKEPFLLAPLTALVWMIGTRRFARSTLALGVAGSGVYLWVRHLIDKPMPFGAALTSPLAALGGLVQRGLELLLIPGSSDALPPYHGSLLFGIAFVGLLAVGLWRLRGRPAWAALLAPWPVVGLAAPAAAQIGLIGDRYFYLALAGLCIAAALAATPLRERIPSLRLIWLLPLALAPGTIVRGMEWRDDVMLFSASLRRSPESPRAAFHLAYHLQVERHDCRAALPLYEKVMHQDGRAANNLLACLLELNDFQAVAGLGPRLAGEYPDNPKPATNTARALLRLGDTAGAEKWARIGISRDQQRPASWVLLGNVVEQAGRQAEARAAYQHAAGLDPADPAARAALDRLRP